MAARIPARWSVIVCASLTNGRRRQRDAHASQTFQAFPGLRERQRVDVAQLAVEQERAVPGPVGGHDLSALEQLLRGLVGGAFQQRARAPLIHLPVSLEERPRF